MGFLAVGLIEIDRGDFLHFLVFVYFEPIYVLWAIPCQLSGNNAESIVGLSEIETGCNVRFQTTDFSKLHFLKYKKLLSSSFFKV